MQEAQVQIKVKNFGRPSPYLVEGEYFLGTQANRGASNSLILQKEDEEQGEQGEESDH